jgi:site-specific DNA-adenine methylase
MKPFFTFYGGKWRAAARYPNPNYDTIIEPFAGSAGYALRYHTKKIILVEKDPVIAALWRWLIKAKPKDIMDLPLINMKQVVTDFDICDEARSLIGFWLNKGTTAPSKSPSAWMRQGIRPKSFWGAEIRSRISQQVEGIKHWTCIEGDYSIAPNLKATWFIDPPYLKAGIFYKKSSKHINYTELGAWCKNKKGQVMVCENEGATWLPFEPFITIKSTEGSRGKSKSRESLWICES